MFWILLAAAIVFLAAAVAIWFWLYPVRELVAVLEDVGPEESPLVGWFTEAAEWMPFLVLLSIVVLLVAGAIYNRSSAHGGI